MINYTNTLIPEWEYIVCEMQYDNESVAQLNSTSVELHNLCGTRVFGAEQKENDKHSFYDWVS